MTVSERTHYEVIGSDPAAPKSDLKAAYTAALEDAQASGDANEVAAVRRAWQVLSDPVQRQRYDEALGVGHRGAVEPSRNSSTADDDVDLDDLEDLDGEVVEAEIVDELAPGSVLRGVDGGVAGYLEQPTIGRRLTASIIDVVTLVAVFSATSAIAYAALSSDGARFAAVVVLLEVWILALFVIPTARTGQTLGKRFTYIMTVDRETGNLASPVQVVRRYMIQMVAVPLLLQLGAFLALFYGLSYAMGRDQLSLADRLAKTVVVVARYKPSRTSAGT